MTRKILFNKRAHEFALFPNGKKGEEILIFYWLIILIAVAGGVFAMVYIFYGTPYDIRDIESTLLLHKVADCVSYAGRINANIISNGSFKEINLQEECHFTFGAEWEEEQYYSEINFYGINNPESSIFEIVSGNKNLQAGCEIQSGDYKKLPRCSRDVFYSVDDSNSQYIIKILTSVRKTEKNVKI